MASHGRFDTPLQATLTGIKDLFGRQQHEADLTDDLRIDGQRCLVTGASSGLGFAIAVQLAQRGGHVIMVSRSGIPDKGEEAKRLSGSDAIEQIRCDLSDLSDVKRLADQLAEGPPLDIVVENAGVASPRAKRTPQGLEAMFVTNYLAKFALLAQLLHDGTIPNRTFGKNGRAADAPIPRVLFISSDSHQGASAIDWNEFGDYRAFDINKAINNYSYFKLILNTYAAELARQLEGGDGEPDVAVHAMCPGPVDTKIIRDAPFLLRQVMKVVFRFFFRAPDVAARPSVYMCVEPKFQQETGLYMHMFNDKKMDPKTYDRAEGEKLWARSIDVLRRVDAWTDEEAS